MKSCIHILSCCLLLLIVKPTAGKAQCFSFITIKSGTSESNITGHTLAIGRDGTLFAWGRNNQSQLGDGTTTSRTAPKVINNMLRWKQVAAGLYHSLAISADGRLWAWGRNTEGQLGFNATVTAVTTPSQVGTATNWIAVAAGEYHSLALTSEGKLYSWGANNYLQTGDVAAPGIAYLPRQILTGKVVKSISSGANHCMAITADGKLYVWGQCTQGQLGIGATGLAFAPSVNTFLPSPKAVYAGANHSFVITSTGQLVGFGANTLGQLGDGSFTSSSMPKVIGPGLNWMSIATGNTFTLGITSNRRLFAWGSNAYGQLGQLTAGSPVPNPIQVGLAANWASVSAGSAHAIAIAEDGSPWLWGLNFYGQIGDTTVTDVTNGPKKIYTQIVAPDLMPSGLVTVNQIQGQYTQYIAGCGLIAAINSTKPSLQPIEGITTVRMWKDVTQHQQYVKRHFEILPDSNANSATGRITLYFTQQDFTDFNEVNAVKLPVNASDPGNNKAFLRIECKRGFSVNLSGEPETYFGSITEINPDDADIIWNATRARWEVTFDATGFGGFFVKTSAFLLHEDRMHLSANSLDAKINLTFTYSGAPAAAFSFEKSANATGFYSILERKNIQNQNDLTIKAADPDPFEGPNFYRVKAVFPDGQVKFSNTIQLTFPKKKKNSFLWPNPAITNTTLYINETSKSSKVILIMRNEIGKIIRVLPVNTQKTEIDLIGLVPGIYFIQAPDGKQLKLLKK